MKKVLEVINELKGDGVVSAYAMGGATALLFYTEPALTFDIDIFISLPHDSGPKDLVDLSALYQALASKGYRAEKEHVMIAGIPVQFIPVYNELVAEAVQAAVTKEYEGVPTKVLKMEHLLAIMLDTDRPKDRERIGKLIDEVSFDRALLESILKRHALGKRWKRYIEE